MKSEKESFEITQPLLPFAIESTLDWISANGYLPQIYITV